MLVHAECLTCTLVALRSVLNDCYLSLFEDVYVGNHRWLSVEVQSESPINLGLLTVGKSEPGVARDEVVSHPMRIWFNCLYESLHCIPTAHGLCATIVKNDMAWMVGLI